MRARWRYLDDGREPPTAWRSVDFDDGAWRAGEAQLGYGDGDEATVVSSGPDPARRHVTTWFRRRFEVRGRAGVQRVLLRLLRDDGAVVHLNGREVHRSNLPTGPVGPGTRASETVGGLAEDAFEEVMLDPALLREGPNVVAVEVHQATADSSDLGFDLALIGYRADAGPAPGGDPVLLAAGDIARCDGTDDDATARASAPTPRPDRAADPCRWGHRWGRRWGHRWGHRWARRWARRRLCPARGRGRRQR